MSVHKIKFLLPHLSGREIYNNLAGNVIVLNTKCIKFNEQIHC